MPDPQKRFADVTRKFFEKHGIKEVGYWTAVIGTGNGLTYLLTHENLAAREKAGTSFSADPDRINEFAASEKNGSLVVRTQSSILAPTYFSPMK